MYRKIQNGLSNVYLSPSLHNLFQTKCEEYWPQDGSQSFGEVRVTLDQEKEKPDCIKRTLKAEKVSYIVSSDYFNTSV